MTDFEIITNPEKFKKVKGINIDDPRAFEPIGKVHNFFTKVTGIRLKAKEFIKKIGEIMEEGGNGDFKPTSKNDILDPDTGKGLDSLSRYLESVQGMTREKYQKIMAYANRGYLDHFYIKHSGRFNSAGN